MTVGAVRGVGGVVVREINLAVSADVQRFIELPFTLYQNTPQWTPPLRREMRDLMDPARNGFFVHSVGGFFIAERAGKVVGRIAALWNRFYNEKHHNDTAFFHWFECIDDRDIAQALFAAVDNWASERGLRRVIGPIGFVQPDPPGILVEGFEHEGTMDVPWHFPYYEGLLTEAGFLKHMDYLSGYLHRDMAVPAQLLDHGAAALERGGYTVKSFRSKKELWPWVERFFRTYLNAFTEVPDFFPMSAREFESLAERMMMVVEPTATKLLLQGDELIGFLVSCRDLTPGLRRSWGRLLPLGWWHLLRSQQTSQQCNIIALGVLPERQRGGANLALVAELVKTLAASRFPRAEIVQIVGGNMNTHGDMSRLGAKWDKTHRVFRCEVRARA